MGERGGRACGDESYLPVAGAGVAAVGGDLESVADAEAAVGGELVGRAAEEAGDAAGLPRLAQAVEEPHRLPVEVVAALHREERVQPPPLPRGRRYHGRPQQQQQEERSRRHWWWGGGSRARILPSFSRWFVSEPLTLKDSSTDGRRRVLRSTPTGLVYVNSLKSQMQC